MANLNDKLISYGNLAEFQIKLLNDLAISEKSTWSSQKISAMIADAGFAVEIVAELPATGAPHTIYFVPSSNPETSNVKDEFMYVNGAWEQVGSTAIDLTPYVTKAELDASLALKADLSYVDSSLALKADVYEVATTADIEALFAEPAPPTQPNDEIWYTSTNGQIVVPSHPEELPTIVSNTYANGKGIIKCAQPITELISVEGSGGEYFGVFQDCSTLETIQLPETLTLIGDFTFSRCTSLTSVTIPNGVTAIGEYDGKAFYMCSNLTSVTIPESVTSIIGYLAFDTNSNIDIRFESATPPTINSYEYPFGTYGEGSASTLHTNATLYVPSAAYEDYYNDENYWFYQSHMVSY